MQKLAKVFFTPIHIKPLSIQPLGIQPLRAGRDYLVGIRAAAIAATLGWLSGCALESAKIDRTPPPDPTIIMRPTAPSASDALQTLLLQTKKMAPAELAIEKEKARAEFNADKSEINRIKLALLLALPAAGNASAAALAADDAELTTLVDPVAASAGTTTVVGTNNTEPRTSEAELKVLALLIQSNVLERKRLREQARDAQSRTQVAKAELTKSEQEARILRTKVEELEKQLTALKSIERSVNSRTKAKTDPVPKEGAPK
jgi:hypothetical protein